MFDILNTTFSCNFASSQGGVMWCSGACLNITNSRIEFSAAVQYGGIMLALDSLTHINHSTFYHNSGSLYLFNSNLDLSGHTIFDNSTKLTKNASHFSREGGAITGFQSTLTFTGSSTFSNNQASIGRAIMVVESKISI